MGKVIAFNPRVQTSMDISKLYANSIRDCVKELKATGCKDDDLKFVSEDGGVEGFICRTILYNRGRKRAVITITDTYKIRTDRYK